MMGPPIAFVTFISVKFVQFCSLPSAILQSDSELRFSYDFMSHRQTASTFFSYVSIGCID